jgi:hypothetical protein
LATSVPGYADYKKRTSTMVPFIFWFGVRESAQSGMYSSRSNIMTLSLKPLSTARSCNGVFGGKER